MLIGATLECDRLRLGMIPCSQLGHLGLLVACLYPHCHVTLVELRERGSEVARKRALEAGLTNVTVFCGSMQDYYRKGAARIDSELLLI